MRNVYLARLLSFDRRLGGSSFFPQALFLITLRTSFGYGNVFFLLFGVGGEGKGIE